MTITRRPSATPEELRAWIALCERLAREARLQPLRLVRDDEQAPEPGGSYAEVLGATAGFSEGLSMSLDD